jgi:hypothetical protein
MLNVDHFGGKTIMDKHGKDRPGRAVFNFVWQSAVGAVVAVVVLLLLRKYT